MTIARISVVAILTLAGTANMLQAAQPVPAASPEPIGTAFPLCRVPVAKGYQVEPGFCPQQLAAMTPHAVSDGGDCGCCGPFGIPPIYTAGNYVVVRATPEVHVRVAKFLEDLGAYVPPKLAR